MPLADVVEDHAEEQELGLRQLAHHLGEQRQRVRELALAQPLELAHADERVLVDGVDVERVVGDQALEVRELRERAAFSTPSLCISSERLVDVPRGRAARARNGARHRRRVARGRQQGERCSRSSSRVPVESVAPWRCASAKTSTSVAGSSLEDLAAGDRRARALDAHAVADACARAAPRSGTAPASARSARSPLSPSAIHGRRVGVVASHEAPRRPGRPAPKPSCGREALLELEGELILVAAGHEVHARCAPARGSRARRRARRPRAR